MNNRKISHLRGSGAAQNARNAVLATGDFNGFFASMFTALVAGFEGVSGSLRWWQRNAASIRGRHARESSRRVGLSRDGLADGGRPGFPNNAAAKSAIVLGIICGSENEDQSHRRH
jgi:hypothetical protein